MHAPSHTSYCVSAHTDPAESYSCNQCHQSAHHQQTLLGPTPPHKLPVVGVQSTTQSNNTDCNICRAKLQCCCWLEGRAPGWAVLPPRAVTTSACPPTSHCSSFRQSASSGCNSWLQTPITAKDLPSGESGSRRLYIYGREWSNWLMWAGAAAILAAACHTCLGACMSPVSHGLTRFQGLLETSRPMHQAVF